MDNPTPTRPPDGPDAERLAERLEQYLDALASGSPPPSPQTPDPEWERLRSMVQLLHHLRTVLRPSSACDSDAPTQDYVPPDNRLPAPRDGHRLGKYRVIRILGEGGQGTTLLAEDPDLRRHVVLKVYHEAKVPQERERVLNEGRALARVRSPFVAQCHGAETIDGAAVLVMEYVPGTSLARRLRSGPPLSIREALDVVRQVAEGLAAVHACGLLHRDIKPGNILLADDGRPRLVDFGLAAGMGSSELGQVSGTPNYMAPEQARGEADRIDARTDVFGLGAVLYELLTGKAPHAGKDRQAILQAAKGEVTPPQQVNPRLPRSVEGLCLRCVARDPADRFASAADVASAIRHLQGRTRRTLIVALAVALVPVAALGLFFASRGFQGPVPTTQPAAPLTAEEEQHPAGRPLLRQFALKVEPVGAIFDPQTRAYVLKVGQVIKFKVETGIDCDVILCDLTDTKVIQLFPNDHDVDTRFHAGQPRLLPEKKQGVEARAPSDLEHVYVLAATNPQRLQRGDVRGGFEVFEKEDLKDWLTDLRELGAADSGDKIAEVVLRFRVEK
jgi:serine/threonine-protein kinase